VVEEEEVFAVPHGGREVGEDGGDAHRPGLLMVWGSGFGVQGE